MKDWKFTYLYWNLAHYVAVFIISSIVWTIDQDLVSPVALSTALMLAIPVGYFTLKDSINLQKDWFIVYITYLIVAVLLDVILIVILFRTGLSYYKLSVWIYYTVPSVIIYSGGLLANR